MSWLIWIALALAALAGEALTTALILASFGIAALVVAPLSLFVGLPLQIVSFAGLSLLLLVVARPAILRLFPAGDMARILPWTGPVGRLGTVVERVDQARGQIRIGGGEFWSARALEPGVSIPPGRDVQVVRIQGLTALVQPVRSASLESDASGPTPFGLSEREVEVLRLVALGMSNQEIADRLVLSPRTVHHHVSHILNKMGAASRVEAVRLGIERGLVSPSAPP
jgi:membrane protein implicated in regulation of membrane protease activity/DNA-binding CsgD family transcriptional regulator